MKLKFFKEVCVWDVRTAPLDEYGDLLARIFIAGSEKKENGSSVVIGTVSLTIHRDIIIDWYMPEYIRCIQVQRLADEAKNKLLNYDSWKTVMPEKRFRPGKTYCKADWFTGGRQLYNCVDRTEHTVRFSLESFEADGIHHTEREYELCMDENSCEYILLFAYKGNQCILRACEEEEVPAETFE